MIILNYIIFLNITKVDVTLYRWNVPIIFTCVSIIFTYVCDCKVKWLDDIIKFEHKIIQCIYHVRTRTTEIMVKPITLY
jgi:hypothetical protein